MRVPSMPEKPKPPSTWDNYQKQRVQELLDLRKRKDWANSEAFKKFINLNDESEMDLSSQDSSSYKTSSPDTDMVTPSESEYSSKILLKRLAQAAIEDQEESKQITKDADLQEQWAKAVKTEQALRKQLVWYKRLPKEVFATVNSRNLIKIFLRITKLYNARSSALKILRLTLALKLALRGPIEH